MEITGTLVALLETNTGVGANGPWKKKTFVLESKEKFPKKVAITAWNEQADLADKLSAGTELKISFNLESREFNGKWYTDVKAWRIDRNIDSADAPGQAQAADMPPPADFGSGEDDDLPF